MDRSILKASLATNVCAFQTLRPFDFGENSASSELNTSLLKSLPNPPFWIEQVHGTNVIQIPEDYPNRVYERPKADACFTFQAEKPCAVLTADCLPILLHARYLGIQAVAAVHAGWRGLSGGVLSNTIRSIRGVFLSKIHWIASMKPYSANFLEGYNPEEPFDLSRIQFSAWIGASISQKCFEVGSEVYDAFVSKQPGNAKYFEAKGSKYLADLNGLATFELCKVLGVCSIFNRALCTYSEPDKFYSHRLDGTCGRMMTLIYFKNIEEEVS